MISIIGPIICIIWGYSGKKGRFSGFPGENRENTRQQKEGFSDRKEGFQGI